MSQTKFKVGDKVVFDAKYHMKNVLTIDEIKTSKGVTTVYVKDCEDYMYAVYDYEIEPCNPYAKWHAIAREICGGNENR